VATPPAQQHDEKVAVGSVISWSVPAGPTLDVGGHVLPGARVKLVISTGPAPRTIPKLVGTTVAKATAALKAIQLRAKVAAPVFSDTIRAGSVVSARPADRTTGVARGSVVTLTPSKGVDLVT